MLQKESIGIRGRGKNGINAVYSIDKSANQRGLRIQLFALICVELLIGSTFLVAFTDISSGDDKNNDSSYPISEWDLNFYLNESRNIYYAISPGYYVTFSVKTGKSGLCNLSTRQESIDFSPKYLIMDNGTWKNIEEVKGEINGTTLVYTDAFGEGIDLFYQNCLNGIKEMLIFRTPMNISSDIEFISAVTPGYKTPNMMTKSGKVNVTTRIDEDSYLMDRQGSSQGFVFHATYAFKSFDPLKKYIDYSCRQNKQNLSYSLRHETNTYTHSVYIPKSLLSNNEAEYPICVDPSLGPIIANEQSYTNETIEQLSDLTILGGGGLTLINCTLEFMGDYNLLVNPDGYLDIDGTTITSDNYRYIFNVDGNIYSDNSTIEFMAAERYGYGGGLYLDCQNAELNFTTVRHSDATGINLTLDGTGADNVAINNCSVVTNQEHGIRVGPTSTNILIEDCNISDNSDVGMLVSSGTSTNLLTIHDNTISSNDNGLELTGNNLEATITSCKIYGNTVLDVLVNECLLNLCDVLFDRSKGDVTGGNGHLNVEWYFTAGIRYPSLDNDTKVTAYEIKNVMGAPVAGGSTGADGIIGPLLLKEYEQTIGGIVDHTMHKLTLMGTGYPFDYVYFYIDTNKDFVIHAEGDADCDGITNDIEAQEEIHCLEAEDHVSCPSDREFDEDASGNFAAKATVGDLIVEPGSFYKFPTGNYRLFLRMRGTDSDCEVDVTVIEDETSVSTSSFILGGNYEWYSTKNFSLDGGEEVFLEILDNTSGGNPGHVLLDKIILVDIDEIPEGMITDALDVDTDGDLAPDAYEAKANIWWFEGEWYSDDSIADTSAHNSWAATHDDSNPLLFRKCLDAYSDETNHRLWVKVKTIVSGQSMFEVRITISYGGQSFNRTPAMTTFFNASMSYEWFNTTNISFASMDPTFEVTIEVFDRGDQNLADSSDPIRVDKVCLERNPAPQGFYNAFYLSDALDMDTDGDNLTDGKEIFGYFTADRQEAVNYTAIHNVTIISNTIYFDDFDDNFTVEFYIRERGNYQFIFPVSQGVFLEENRWQATGDEEDLMNYTNLTVFDSSSNEVPMDVKFCYLHEITQAPQSGALQWINRTSLPKFRYFLDVGYYNVTVWPNETAIRNAFEGEPIVFSISYVYLLDQKRTLNTIDVDYDNDVLWDGHEVSIGTYPMNLDSDYDHLRDDEEVYQASDGYITNPLNNDTDLDSLLDAVEVGIFGDSDPTSTTDPTNIDTDGDLIPDGWIDGWIINSQQYRASQGWYRDTYRQPYEGEDLDGDGAVDSGPLAWDSNGESTGGETDPNLFDTDIDGMDDGWEIELRGVLNQSYGEPLYLNPLVNDSHNDSDLNVTTFTITGDGLLNYQEYNLNLNPIYMDSDMDWIEDGNETYIMVRTNVDNGTHCVDAFEYATATDWIYFDEAPYFLPIGRVYSYSSYTVNPANGTKYTVRENGTRLIREIFDNGAYCYNASLDEIYVWSPDSDFSDEDGNDVLEGTVYVFVYNGTIAAETNSCPVEGYHKQEMAGPVNPLDNDSDGDGVIDGWDGPTEGNNSWWKDADSNGFPNAFDVDSDGDDIRDGVENINRNATHDPGDWETNPYCNDTDNDNIDDMQDSEPLDYDNDGLNGYGSFSKDGVLFPAFGGTETLGGTAWNNPDTDGDGLEDGVEDSNLNGRRDAGETKPIDVDSDDDGLWDGDNVTIGETTYSGEVHYNTDPLQIDTDDDNVQDGTEVGLTNSDVVFSDSNGTMSSLFTPDSDASTTTDPYKKDSDGDGLWDGWRDDFPRNGQYDEGELGEDYDADGMLDSDETGPTTPDTDEDRLSDFEERQYGSNPRNKDSDSDGLYDCYEPYPMMNYDNDSKPNILDANSDDSGDEDYNATDDNVVFKTNAIRSQFNTSTWITVYLFGSTLSKYVYEETFAAANLNMDSLLSLTFKVKLGNMTVQYETPDKQLIYKNSTHIFILDIDLKIFNIFRQWQSGDITIPSNATTRIDGNYSQQFQVIFNWSGILDSDIDNDGLETNLEIYLGSNSSDPDTDEDGLIDGIEFWIYKSSVIENDTDGDELLDGDEVYNWATSPTNTDSDHDDLWDGYNITVGGQNHKGELSYGTNNTKWDSDYDGMPDGFEANFLGLNPMIDDKYEDPDNDGMKNIFEYEFARPLGWHENVHGVWWNGTNVTDPDSDDDYMPDGWEYFFNCSWPSWAQYHLNPLDSSDASQDPDNDLLNNLFEYAYWYEGQDDCIDYQNWNYLQNGVWWNGTNPANKDTDGDGYTDKEETASYYSVLHSNATNPDTDGDGLWEMFERMHGWNITIIRHNGAGVKITNIHVYSDPTKEYTIGNEFNNVNDAQKFLWLLNPNVLDSDGDGMNDKYEIEHFTEDSIKFHPNIVEPIPPEIIEARANFKINWSIGFEDPPISATPYMDVMVDAIDNVDIQSVIITIKGVQENAIEIDGTWSTQIELSWMDVIEGAITIDVGINVTDINGNWNNSIYRLVGWLTDEFDDLLDILLQLFDFYISLVDNILDMVKMFWDAIGTLIYNSIITHLVNMVLLMIDETLNADVPEFIGLLLDFATDFMDVITHDEPAEIAELWQSFRNSVLLSMGLVMEASFEGLLTLALGTISTIFGQLDRFLQQMGSGLTQITARFRSTVQTILLEVVNEWRTMMIEISDMDPPSDYSPNATDYHVAVLFGEFTNMGHNPDHTDQYFSDIMDTVTSYIYEATKESIRVQFHNFTNNSNWYNVGRAVNFDWNSGGFDGDYDGSNYYTRELIRVVEAAEPTYSNSSYNLTICVQPWFPHRMMERLNTADLSNVQYISIFDACYGLWDDERLYTPRISISAYSLSGLWAHEIFHAFNNTTFPSNRTVHPFDMYFNPTEMGEESEIGFCGLMGSGAHRGIPDGIFPNLPSIITMENITLYQIQDITNQLANGVDVNLVTSSNMNPGDNMILFWADPDDPVNDNDPWAFYILEARSNSVLHSYWDRTVPNTGVYIYRVHNNPLNQNAYIYDIVGILTIDSLNPTLYRVPEWANNIGGLNINLAKIMVNEGTVDGLVYDNFIDDITIRIRDISYTINEITFEVRVSNQVNVPIFNRIFIQDIWQHNMDFWKLYIPSVLLPLDTFVDELMNALMMASNLGYYLWIALMLMAGFHP